MHHVPWRRQGTISIWSTILPILTNISERFEPVLVKISPALDESSQLQYLKKNKGSWSCGKHCFQMTVATLPLVSIIHTDHPSGISPTDISLQYPNLFEKKEESTAPEKNHFGNASLTKRRTNERNFLFNCLLFAFIFKRFPIFRAQEIRFFSA